ncbi:hypothetical protein GOAMI_04_00590 [Gordonia amicalis NBRC 100051 = JCM 11271]|nr:hypothetical protein GOAMI_04_00590 [Gordonia amicalis NBRC 100051 = JCM 11271]
MKFPSPLDFVGLAADPELFVAPDRPDADFPDELDVVVFADADLRAAFLAGALVDAGVIKCHGAA